MSSYADSVVEGTFTGRYGSGTGSDYRMTPAGNGDAPVTLWSFTVSRVLTGSVAPEIVVAILDPEKVVSDDAVAIEKDTPAVLFLTEEFQGARAITGGNRGIWWLDDDGRLRPVHEKDNTFPDASTEAELERVVHA